MAQVIEIAPLALHDQVVARLRTMLVEGAIAPGAKLNERELSAQLRVSRTPLREAIKLLAAEGLVELSPNRGARVRVVAPSTLLPPGIERMGVEVARDMREGLQGADIVMMLRLQRERMNGSFVPSTSEYFHYYGLDQKKLAYAKPDALVMHPGPMNRGVEIDSIVADGAQSLIREQVEMGVAVRMAVLEALARNLPNA